ncbi:MAG: hypothetical protein ACQEQ7_06170 [Thermodesulfobacteriota bacterium]
MMNHSDSMGAVTFRDKPEQVIRLPKWVLPKAHVEAYRAIERLAVVEIAGRDSVAAAVQAVAAEGFTDLVPAYAYTGTEYGEWSTVQDAVTRLSERLPDVRVHPLVVLGSPRFWQAVNGRFMGELVHRLGTFSPCVGCHLYLHSVRIPLAVRLGHRPIIAGERERHDGRVKINQISEALNCYESVAGEFRIRLLFPLRHIPEGQRIRDILGNDWEEGQAQPGCVLSGNYRGADGRTTMTVDQVSQYLHGFAVPLTRAVIQAYLRGEVPDHLKLAAQILARGKT